MVVCKFFLQGNCRFGQNCRNEHPGNNSSGGQNQNRFGALANNNSGGNRAGSANNLTEASIIARDAPLDLDPQNARPKWIFSSYGPTKTAAMSLMEENEYSAEEIRLRYYQAASRGQDAQADQEATRMYQKISQDYQNILNNVNNIPKFLEDGEKKRPNRHDFTNVSLFDGRQSREQFIRELGSSNESAFTSASSGNGASSGFGSGASGSGFGSGGGVSQNPFAKPPTSTFGQPAGPSAFGSKPAFGQSGFGNNASGTSNAAPAFGQSSTPAFGQSAFGKPSMGTGLGQPAFGSSGFGQGTQKSPFAPATASSGFGQAAPAFGQPTQPTTTFGQPSQPSTGFGQPSQPTSSFGQPSQSPAAFGQPSQPTSAFGQPSQPGTSSAFGQPSQSSAAFGQPSQPTSAFGQPSQPGASSAFGQPSQPGSGSGFGKPSQSTSAFGQPSQPSNSFGGQGSSFQKPVFGSTAQPNSIFGQNPQQSNGVGTSFGQPAAPSSAGFGKPKNQETNSEPTQRPNPFGTDPSGPSGFGTPPIKPQQQQGNTPIAPGGDWNPINPLVNKPSATLHITQRLPAQPPTFDMSKRLTTFRGQRVAYVDPPHVDVDRSNLPEQYRDMMAAKLEPFPAYKRADTGEMEKIWFPEGPREKSLDRLSVEVKRLDLEGEEGGYTEAVKGVYEGLYETGGWQDGLLPLVPPMREWVSYDF